MAQCSLCGARSETSCTRGYCPLRIKREAFVRMAPLAKIKDFNGPAPAPFVGRYGYPHVNVGIMGAVQPNRGSEELDAPKLWAAKGFGVGDVVGIRSTLINARFTSDIRHPSKMVSVAQEVSMASRPPDVEVSLKQRPGLVASFDKMMAPSGPSAAAGNVVLTSNPTVSSKVEKVVSDTDLKASEAMRYLYDKGFDENHIMKMLSVGTMGLQGNRRLVPTRWSITASDDVLGKQLALELRDFSECGFDAYYGGYLGNHYLILCFPGPWSYELFETRVQPNLGREASEIETWTDFEGPFGRSDYADNTVGGYYAARLGILERLHALKRKGSILALRFITEDYSLPLGVWVVREATRASMSGRPIEFSDSGLMIEYAKAKVRKTFGLDLNGILCRSKLLSQRRTQPRLSQFVS